MIVKLCKVRLETQVLMKQNYEEAIFFQTNAINNLGYENDLYTMMLGNYLLSSEKKEKIIDYKKNGNLTAGFQYEWSEHSKVLVREEVELYTLVNFFAEVGGYLGLFIGVT